MKFLNKFSIRNLKLNKKRTVSTIIGVILSTALICGFSILCLSFKETLVQAAIVNSGYYHLQIENTSKQERDALVQNRDIEDIHYVNKIGYGILKGLKNESKPYIQLNSMDRNTFDKLAFHLKKGRFPKNNHEILISEHMLSNGDVEYKIGDVIELDIKERYSIKEDHKIDDSCEYEAIDEKLIHTKPYEFTIVGIIERPVDSVITTNISNSIQDIFITLKHPNKYKTSISQIVGEDHFDNIGSGKMNFDSSRIQINNELIRWETLSFSDGNTKIMYSVGAIIIAIIMLTSIYCIRNSFAISLVEKKKMYGMLASIGATKKQLRNSVLTEAYIIACIGIPIGIIAGIGAIYIVIKVVNSIIGDMLFPHLNGIVYKVSFIPILIAIILGFITIYFSARSSAKKASRVSPIQNLRNVEDISCNEKQVKSSNIIRKLFGMGGVIAYKNLKRSKKKYRTTVISLMISICVFISISTFIQDAFALTAKYFETIDYNLMIEDYDSLQKIDQQQSLKNKVDEILKNEQVIYLYQAHYGGMDIFDLSKINKKYYSKVTQKNNVENMDQGQPIYISIVSVDDASYRKFCKKIGVNYDDVKDKGILNDYHYLEQEEYKNQFMRSFTFEKGERIKGYYGEKKQKIEKTIGAITNQSLYGMEDTEIDSGYLIVNQKYEKDVTMDLSKVLIKTDNVQVIEKEIQNNSLNITNLDQFAKESNAMRIVTSIFLYGFLTVIILISITNIFNTITSNIDLRQREFAMLKSVGMKSSEFNRMVNLEILFYCTKSLALGVLFGCMLSVMINNAFKMKMFYFPIHAILISIIVVFIIVFIIMHYSVHKINSQNIIETIRNENI